MKVLVTGGAGFIGSHVVKLLLENNHVPVVVDNFSTGQQENLPEGVTVHRVDICDREALRAVFEQERPEVVCHQAAQMSVGLSVQQPSYDASVNILGTLHVLEAAVAVSARRVVFASSGGVLYGDVTTPAVESAPANPVSPYGISKWAGERYLRFFSEEHQLQTVALRYSNVYGPRQNPHGEAGVVAIFCRKMLKGEQTTINGDGRYVRDYVYVGDVARANLLSLTQPIEQQHLALNVGTGLGLDVNELAGQLQVLCQQELIRNGSQLEIPDAVRGPARAGDLRSNLVDSSALQKRWGWLPETELAEGLEQTVSWFAKA